MIDGLTSDGILLVFQGEYDLCGILKVLDQGAGGDEMVPDKEHKFQERSELDCSAVVCALGVLLRPVAEVEAQLEQVGNVPVLWVGGGGSCGYNGLDNVQGVGGFPLDWGIFDPVSF